MGQGDCSQSGEGIALAEHTALELFQIGALLLGNEDEAITLVEETVAAVQADPCCDAAAAHDEARDRLIHSGLERMHSMDPAAFAAAGAEQAQSSCIEDDEATAAGISSDRMAELTHGSGRLELRAWLAQLPLALRAVFVLRAVVGLDSAATAENLRQLGDSGWTADSTSQVFRQALCSLANSMVHSHAARQTA